MADIQRIFPDFGTMGLDFTRKPLGAFGTWDQQSAVFSGPGIRYMGPLQGTAQRDASPFFAVVPAATSQAILVAQLQSDPLRQAFIPSAEWRVGFAAQLLNAGANYTWQGVAALFVLNGQTGQRRATIFDTTAIGSGGRTTTAEVTCLASIVGQGVQLRAADILILELGIVINNSASALAPQVSMFSSGITPITIDNLPIASAQTVLEAPQRLLLTLPQAGVSATASINHAGAVSLVKEAWPPFSGVLYDWDNPEKLISRIFEAYGDFIKLYVYDQSDRLFRETSPLTMVELLPAWEAALGISLGDTAIRMRSADQRRQAVLSRLREAGPLTIFSVASIFGQLAGYSPGTSPEVFELDHVTQRASNEYTDPVGLPIPIGTAFGNTNLIRFSPTLLDGGIVWDTGVLLRIEITPVALGTERIHVQLTGPDYTVESWVLGPNLTTEFFLRSTKFARGPVHGNWVLNVYRESSVPGVDLLRWKLNVLGRNWGGRGQSKFIWSVYLDPLHQLVDRRDIQGTLDRITQSYAESFVIYDKTSIPGSRTHRAGMFIPGA